MKKIFFGIFVSLISLTAYANQDLEVGELKGNVKQLLQKSYNVEVSYKKLSNKAQPLKIYKYDYDSGLLITTESKIDMTGGADIGKKKDDSYYRIKSNKDYYKNGIKEKTVLCDNGVEIGETTYQYNSENKLSQITYDDKSIRKFTYGKNNITETVLKLKYGLLIRDLNYPTEIYTYNNSNQLVTLDYDCIECYQFKFNYNKDGLLEKMTDYKSGVQETETFFKYLKFDSEGNWLERLEYRKDKVKAKLEVREFTYNHLQTQ